MDAEGNKTGGRQKGTPNKVTKTAKEAIAIAADGLGGADGLLAWAQRDERNESAFWTSIYPKLLPHTLAADPDSPFGLTVKLSEEAKRLMGELVPGRTDTGISPSVSDGPVLPAPVGTEPEGR